MNRFIMRREENMLLILFSKSHKKRGLADRVVVGKNDWTVKTKVQYDVGLICHNNKIFWHCPYHFSMQVLEHAAL